MRPRSSRARPLLGGRRLKTKAFIPHLLGLADHALLGWKVRGNVHEVGREFPRSGSCTGSPVRPSRTQPCFVVRILDHALGLNGWLPSTSEKAPYDLAMKGGQDASLVSLPRAARQLVPCLALASMDRGCRRCLPHRRGGNTKAMVTSSEGVRAIRWEQSSSGPGERPC